MSKKVEVDILLKISFFTDSVLSLLEYLHGDYYYTFCKMPA